MAISKFKAICLAVLERVRKTRRPVQITRFGEPIAEIVHPSVPKPPATWLGALAGTGRFQGDIVSSPTDERDWEALDS